MSQNHFINVLTEAGLTADARLETALGRVESEPGPWVLWISRPATLLAAHELPPTVTLSFAPGAFLTLTRQLTVRGPLDAGLASRFLVVGEGLVELLGPVDEIVANWWRESVDLNPVEFALQALWARYLYAEGHPAEGVLPAPIRLDGPYVLERTLRILPPATLTGRVNVVLRGQHGRPADPATFVMPAAPPSTSLSSMVSVESGVVLSMERVAFEAPPNAASVACVAFEGTFHQSRIELCDFRSAGAGLRVAWGHPTVSVQLPAAVLLPGIVSNPAVDPGVERAANPNALSVSLCHFEGAGAGALAIDVGAGAPTLLNVRDSQFVGTFGSCISTIGGQLDVTGCQFANAAPSGVGNESADIVTGATGFDLMRVKYGNVINGGPEIEMRVVGRLSDGPPTSPTHVTVTHCVSTSPTFLVMREEVSYSATGSGGAVLTNVRHTPSVPGGSSVLVGPYTRSRALVLQGSRFGASVTVDPNAASDAVVDLGTRFAVGAGFRGTQPIDLGSTSIR